MQRIAVVGSRDERQRVVSILYDIGVLQIEPLSKSAAPLLKSGVDSTNTKEVSEELLRIRSLRAALPYRPAGDRKGFASFQELLAAARSIDIDAHVTRLKQDEEKLKLQLDDLKNRIDLVTKLGFINEDLSVFDLASRVFLLRRTPAPGPPGAHQEPRFDPRGHGLLVGHRPREHRGGRSQRGAGAVRLDNTEGGPEAAAYPSHEGQARGGPLGSPGRETHGGGTARDRLQGTGCDLRAVLRHTLVRGGAALHRGEEARGRQQLRIHGQRVRGRGLGPREEARLPRRGAHAPLEDRDGLQDRGRGARLRPSSRTQRGSSSSSHSSGSTRSPNRTSSTRA